MCPETATERLGRFPDEEKISVQVGLRAQGHLPIIERMLGEGYGWDAIGAAIGWDPATAERWYRQETGAPAEVLPLLTFVYMRQPGEPPLLVVRTWTDGCLLTRVRRMRPALDHSGWGWR